MSGPIVIRPLEGIDELRAAVRLQESTWGEGFSERVPVSMLLVAARLGGVVSGAFTPDGRMVGLVFGLTGIRAGRPVHWSDLLAVSPDFRNGGLGRRLKLHQRERVMPMGIDRIYWTFDPLESRNAHLNLARLGAVADEYVPDMYGPSNSPLHRGLGTDRFVVRWDIASERVAARLAGEAPPTLAELGQQPRAFRVCEGRHGPEPDGVPEGPPDLPSYLVPVPSDIQALKDASAGTAARWREATRAVLEPALARGGEVRELVRDGSLSWYLVVEP